jgi:hypothetical protein
VTEVAAADQWNADQQAHKIARVVRFIESQGIDAAYGQHRTFEISGVNHNFEKLESVISTIREWHVNGSFGETLPKAVDAAGLMEDGNETI